MADGLCVRVVPVLADNYVFVLHDPVTGQTAAVDPAEAGPVMRVLAQEGWTLTHVFNTHHHGDHVGGNLALKRATGCTIVAANADAHRIPAMDVAVSEGDRIDFGAVCFQVLEIPGHTLGHIAFWCQQTAALFCGDTLFSLGCGRLFEGTAAQMWASLQRLKAMPDETAVYCAHEYTLSNAAFALSVEPENQALLERIEYVRERRRNHLPSVPSRLADERAANPFLRSDSAEIRASLSLPDADELTIFTELRLRKDQFRS